MRLKLFCLRRTDEHYRGQSLGFVIAAQTERQARDMAADYRNVAKKFSMLDREEDPAIWYAPSTTCEVLGFAAKHIEESRVILEDHYGD